MGAKKNAQRQALYRTYRPRKLSELVGHETIAKTLQQAISSGLISHAYLLTGPRGVGKTSIARIIAHEINQLEYTGQPHLDIIEIDAASNRGIDEIRDLRDKANLAPSSARYKVYIVDEVHMLTPPAFNALLKTLEEPPAHVIFILATTEVHKLPETIISRTQWFSLRPIEKTAIEAHLKKVAEKEDISISDDALSLLALHARGSLRDGLSMLDQIQNQDESITRMHVESLLGLVPHEEIKKLASYILNGDPIATNELLTKLTESGLSAPLVARQLADYFKHTATISDSSRLDLLEQLLDVAPSHDPYAKLELILLRQASSSKISKQTKTPKEINTPVSASFERGSWEDVLAKVKKSNNSLYAVLRLADIERVGSDLILRFAFPFHKDRAAESKNQNLIREFANEIMGPINQIQIKVDKQLQTTAQSKRPDSMTNVIQMMGGGSIVEYSDG